MNSDETATTWYKPRQIAKLGLIKNSKQSDKEIHNYQFILDLIKDGRLRATNYGATKTRNYWLVSDKAIREYNEGTSI